ncbi:cytochrome c biogenesis CcdA family protein [Streptomyces spiramenti]|uniref:Cytochrome c biogenesis protein CcdA n=1 Tax=Streptomyces spiramenti TaxID=2720606 RepID=A0ABX1AJK9_9ACTN|nr:cytochrome c biogenesis protein CcdA [Streptomyces spiramenti]NJP67314.1 cytochrome c biogenesis protein CcdA [Streptomyces spiramenti]
MTDIGPAAAFAGGALALLSPCGAMLLPAFFATTVGAGPRLLAHGAAFYTGLCLTLVPLGLGAGAAGAAVVGHRSTIVTVTAAALVVLGCLHAAGFGFDPARFLPGARALQRRAATARAGLARSLLLGATGGVAGFCAGPILGAVLTLAAARGDTVSAGLLLAVYGAGTVVPLLALAALWHRLGADGRRRLRGREVRVPGRRLHTTSLLTGTLIAALGVFFWLTDGLLTAPDPVPTAVQSWLQNGVTRWAGPGVDVVAVLLVAGVLLAAWALRTRRRPPAVAACGAQPAGGATSASAAPDPASTPDPSPDAAPGGGPDRPGVRPAAGPGAELL